MSTDGQDQIRLTLLSNAHDFVNESLRNLDRATEGDEALTKFAVIHLAQAVELFLKERLRREHPLLVHRRVEKGHQTVTVDEALARLARCDVDLGEREVKRLRAARDIRNDLMHFEVSASLGQLYAAYVSLFEFASYFHQRELGAELHDSIDEDLHVLETIIMSQFERDVIVFQGEEVVTGWPMELVQAQGVPMLHIDGAPYLRIAHGDALDLLAGNDLPPCHDCAALSGQLHAFGCDAERCPKCGGQLLICDCEDDVLGGRIKLDGLWEDS